MTDSLVNNPYPFSITDFPPEVQEAARVYLNAVFNRVWGQDEMVQASKTLAGQSREMVRSFAETLEAEARQQKALVDAMELWFMAATAVIRLRIMRP